MALRLYWRLARRSLPLLYTHLKDFFDWRYSQFAIASCWALAIAFLSIAISASDAEWFCESARVFNYLGLIWGLGWWLTSDSPKAKKSRNPRPRRSVSANSKKAYRIFQLIGITPFAVVFVYLAFGIKRVEISKKAQSFVGDLIPGNEPTPPNKCAYPGTDLKVFTVLLGPIAAGSGPFPSNIIKLGSDVVLSMNFDPKRRMTISTDIYDRNHDIVVSVDHNRYHVDSSVFEMNKADPSDLSVVIRHDKEQVLHIRYLNPYTISITGVFRTKIEELKVDETEVFRNGVRLPISNVCVMSFGNAFRF